MCMFCKCKTLKPAITTHVVNYKGNLIIVDGDTVKFGDSSEDLQKVTDMIDAKLFGLFPME